MNNAETGTSVQRPVVGVGVAIFRHGAAGVEVLLIRRGKPPCEGEWSIPGGKQDWGETVQEAARREVMEETGLEIANLKLIDVVDAVIRAQHGVVSRHLTLVDFRADWASGEARAGDDASDARWVSVAEAPSYITWTETTRIILAGAAMEQAT